jgi:hypothetical protein
MLITMLFGLCCVITLVPTGLVEFRYYTVALAFLYNEIKITPHATHWNSPINIIPMLFATVNAAVVYVFVARPYHCYGSMNCRFMF